MADLMRGLSPCCTLVQRSTQETTFAGNEAVKYFIYRVKDMQQKSTSSSMCLTLCFKCLTVYFIKRGK